MVVQVLHRRASRRGAPAAYCTEDRPKELDDVGGPDEAHRAGLFGRFPRRRTDFPVPPAVVLTRAALGVAGPSRATGLGRKAAALREGHGVGLLEGERPLHVVAKPPHGHVDMPDRIAYKAA